MSSDHPTVGADCLVVGGGPAGSAAAEAILQRDPNATVLLVERLARPQGTCAGGVGYYWLDEMGLKLPNHLIETAIEEVVVHGPTAQASVACRDMGLKALGWVIDRWGFDQWLLARAEAAGAQVMRSTAFRSTARFNGQWVSECQNADGIFTVVSPYIVDASGPGAVVARSIGWTWSDPDEDVHVGLQYTIPIPDSIPLGRLEMWFRRDKTPEAAWAVPSGYVWSFASRHPYWDGNNPIKAGRYTRLGIGVHRGYNRNPETSAKQCLADFQATHPDFAAPRVSENGGLIPTGRPIPCAQEGLFLVGDAGRHVSALHGGGIWFARVAGQEAGNTIAMRGSDSDYEKAWRRRIGFTLKAHYAGKQVLYDLDNDALDVVVRELANNPPRSSNATREILRAARVLGRHPVLAGRASVRAFKSMVM